MIKDSHDNKGISVLNYISAGFFVEERARNYLRDQGFSTNEIEAVISLGVKPSEYLPRLNAVRYFLSLPEAPELAESDKRIGNIIDKSGAGSITTPATEGPEDAEKKLLRSVRALRPQVDALVNHGDFEKALLLTAQIHLPVKQFFNDVMVNVDDANIRKNRFALLHEVSNLTNRVANISKLAS
jgi:glycyl-tRNA synthetase beta chain